MMSNGNDIYSWFSYPREYQKVVHLNLCNLGIWLILDDHAFITSYSSHLRQRYPDRELVIFAKRKDCDTIACWEKGHGNAVILIDDFESPGFEHAETYPSFWAWFKDAIDLMINEYD